MSVTAFDVKLVIFGDYCEVYKYTKKIIQGIVKPKKIKIKNMNTEEEMKQKKRFSYSIGRTRNTVRRLISANFTNQSSFMTLTFAENLVDVRIANTCFKEFIRYLRHYIRSQGEFPEENFKYIAVIEFQKRGAVHYHIIMTAPFFPPEILAIAWPYGYYKLNATQHVENIGSYVSKYLYKDVDDSRLWGKRAYQTSRNLIRPIEITDKEDIRTYLAYNPRTLTRKGTFDNEYTGRVYYRQYKRKV